MRLKEIREEKEWNQQYVADLLGVSRGTYAMWETEHDIIPIRRLILFCDIFGVSLDYALDLSSTRIYPNERCEMDQNKLKERLKRIRKDSHLTQENLSKRLNITRSLISKYETNTNLILTNFLMEYCKYFHISSDYLMGKIDEEIKLKELTRV